MSLATDSFLNRAIADFRRYTDEPVLNAKYTDAVLIGMIEQSYAHVVAEIHRNHTQPIVARYEVTVATGTTKYLLPNLIGTIYAIYQEGDYGTKVFYDSRSRYSPLGRNVWVEGFTLHVQQNTLSTGDIVTIEYLPTGTARLHDGTCTVDSTGLLVTFGATATTGTLDTHANAYAGHIFRIVLSSEAGFNYVQERTILSYVNSTRVATLDLALNPNPESTGTTSYEIAPYIHRGLDHVVALYLAYWVASIEGQKVTRTRNLQGLYRDAMRNLRLRGYYSNLQDASKLRADNYNNSRYNQGFYL